MTGHKPGALSPQLLKNPWHLLSLGFGAGLSPQAPGTIGTLVGIPLYLLLQPLPAWLYLLGVMLLFFAGIGICQQSSRRLGVHDHPGIVWDEIVGYLFTMVMVSPSWTHILLGFALFRLFDIWKPWPIRDLDRRVVGGLGIMLDDLLAAVYASILLQGYIFFTSG